ncbi:MAG: XRE family transcriptional regulator [Desulfobacterales bacterium]|nr:XRE family transcriptional regulator [Desulfobacterales bacterium]MDD4073334.1 XRE family transcriptional regulator [Desulfobacterales bacterium]MDD4391788.1 XRE family transcriptional regulator [Desulfobacterales bacterium]
MPEEILQIAMRVRELREIAGLSIASLAEEFDIPVERYKAYESGTADIPVSFLHKISGKFNIDITTLLTGKNPKLHIYSLVRKNQGLSVERREQYKYQSLGYNFIRRKADPFLVTVEPKAEDSPIHFNAHPGQEFQYMIQGQMKIVIDKHELILNEGDSLFFDATYRHGMKALGNSPAHFLAIIL